MFKDAKTRFLPVCAAAMLFVAAGRAQHVVITPDRQYTGEITAVSSNGVTMKFPQGSFMIPRARITEVRMPAPTAIQRGIESFEKGAAREAAFALGREVMKYQPLDTDWAPKALIYYGRACVAQKDYANAKTALAAFADYYPDHPMREDALIGLAQVALADGDGAGALEQFRELASAYENQIKPEGDGFARAAAITLGMAGSLERLGEKTAALEAYLKVVAVYPHESCYTEALYGAGKMYAEIGQDKQAEMRFGELIETYPASPSAREAVKARAALRLGDEL